jgi:hypothetical protein
MATGKLRKTVCELIGEVSSAVCEMYHVCGFSILVHYFCLLITLMNVFQSAPHLMR